MFVFIAGMVGVIVGALIVTASAALHSSYKERKEVRYRELEHLVKEIESLNLLNKKVKEILQKRELYTYRWMIVSSASMILFIWNHFLLKIIFTYRRT